MHYCTVVPLISFESHADSSDGSMLVKILVPVGVIGLLATIAVVVILVIVVAVCSKRKRADDYNFQRVAFTNGNEEEEEEEG